MNKIVALSLVLAMALSMMASAASFKDQATINADLMDEINLLVALGVYSENGTGAGYFEPNGTITRAQAAKIVYVLKNKGVDNGATSWTGLNIFTDVEAGAWYEGYVNYCASTGILAGTGDGKYNPNGQLTGVELAKMLLVVIGYKADVEGYTGDKWDANILSDAEAAGIFAEYELPVRGIITREWAAKMIVNAINATKVRYADGELVEMYNGNTPVTFKAQDLGLNEVVDVLIATPNVKLVQSGSAANNTNGKNKLSAVGTFADNVEFEYDANPELLGSKVTVLYKGADLESATKVYGVTAHEDNIITEAAIDAVSYDAKNFETEVLFYENYVYGGKMNATAVENFFKANDSREVKMLDRNNNGKIDVMLVDYVAYDIVEKINPAKFILNLENTTIADISKEADYNKVVFVDTVAKDDVVKLTKDYSTGVEKTVIEKVEAVNGKVEKYNSNGSYVIAGNTYETSAKAMSFAAITGVTPTEETFYVDGKYVVYTAAITAKDDQTNIVLLLDSQAGVGAFSNNKVQVLDTENTKTIYEYYAKGSNETIDGYLTFDAVKNAKGSAYELVMNGEKVYFKNLTTTNDGTNATGSIVVFNGNGDAIAYDADAKKFDITASGAAVIGTAANAPSADGEKLVADDAFFFVKKGDSWKALKASEIVGDITTANVYQFGLAKSGVPTIKYGVIVLGDAEWPTSTDSSRQFAVLATSFVTYKDSKNNDVVEIVATKLDGTTETLFVKGTTLADKGKLVSYTVNGGYASIDVAVKAADTAYFVQGALTATSGKTLYINDTMMTAADDMKVYTVDFTNHATDATKDKLVVAEGSELVLRDEDLASGNNILYSVNNSGKVDIIIVEVDGEVIDNLVK